MNFADTEKTITLDKEYTNIVDNASVEGEIILPVCGYIILE
ncbi:MAG: Beta-galactosidase C-terminal domain [Clostridia bacterium]|nr:Beta-galactosidase C-terminal domain [Clostridia bacterium]